METVCAGKQWDVLLVERNGTIEGALPYLCGKKLGIRYVLQPQLTQYSGPWLDERLDFSERQRVMTELVAQLEALHLPVYSQCFSPSITDWLPFHWAGYEQTTRYTYRFPDISDAALLQRQSSRARRQNMEDVAEACTVDSQFDDVALFAAMHKAYFARKGQRDVLPQELIERVCHTALQRGQGLLGALRDKTGRPVNVSFVVYDDRCAYALMSAITEEAPRNSQTYLFWKIIEHLSSVTRAFDFEGSMEQGNEYFYRTFGTNQTPYFKVFRCRIPFLKQIIKF